MGRWSIGIVLLVLWTTTAQADTSRWSRSPAPVAEEPPACPRAGRAETPTSANELAAPAGPGGDAEVLIVREDHQVESLAGMCGWMLLLPLVWLIPLAAVAGWWFVRRRRVPGRTRATEPEPISLLVVERLARATQRRGGVLATLGIVGVPVMVAMEMQPDGGGMAPVAIAATIVACIGLRGFFIARATLKLIETGPQASAELDGRMVIVRSGSDEALLEAAPGALAAARCHAVPMSIAKSS